jgi:fatty-acyl-CoA synthase
VDLKKTLAGVADRAQMEGRALVALARAGAVGIEPPQRMIQVVKVLRDFGPFGAVVRISALRHGDQPAVTDERGTITYAEFDEAINRLAGALRGLGLTAGDSIGIMCRNHRQPLIVAFAASRVGLNAIWLNTSFSGPQAREVAEREGVDLLVHDADFAGILEDLTLPHGKVLVAIDDPAADQLDQMIAASPTTDLPPAPAKPGRIVLLTSGTTGTPKGAARPEPKGFVVPGSLLERMPMRAGDTTVIGPPIFHGTGLILTIIALSLGNRLVLRRGFDPKQLLDDIETYRAANVCAVPVMLQRILDLGDDAVRQRDLSSLKVIFVAGSQLQGEVALRTMDLMGDVIYNLYGSTEVALATLATPADLREEPITVGKPVLGTRVRLYDDAGVEVSGVGVKGRIFVGTLTPFEGYTGGGGKAIIDGLLSTGDVGHFDAQGRLYIDGRDDDMIVSGGENVFPAEVEELLMTFPGVAECSVIGVADDAFGQRLRAFVVVLGGNNVTEDDLKTLVKDNLARYKVPRDVVFLDELPRNPTGKVLKRVLAEWAG